MGCRSSGRSANTSPNTAYVSSSSTACGLCPTDLPEQMRAYCEQMTASPQGWYSSRRRLCSSAVALATSRCSPVRVCWLNTTGRVSGTGAMVALAYPLVTHSLCDLPGRHALPCGVMASGTSEIARFQLMTCGLQKGAVDAVPFGAW